MRQARRSQKSGKQGGSSAPEEAEDRKSRPTPKRLSRPVSCDGAWAVVGPRPSWRRRATTSLP